MELFDRLKETGFEVAYNHFNKVVSPPFIVYMYTSSNDFIADNINYFDIGVYQIELYTIKKDLVSEAKVEAVFKTYKYVYTKLETWIESEKLYQTIYEIEI